MFHVVDDNEPLLEFLISFIEDVGYEAKGFSSSVEYLEYVKSPVFTPPLAILSDVQMPMIDGFEMLKKVRELYPSIRSAVISAYPKSGGESRDQSCVYLEKPMTMESLEKIIRTFASCLKNGPDPKQYECNSSGVQSVFALDRWSCPHAARCKKHKA